MYDNEGNVVTDFEPIKIIIETKTHIITINEEESKKFYKYMNDHDIITLAKITSVERKR